MNTTGAATATSYAIAVIVDRPFEAVLPATRDALTEHGFGALTEIDMQEPLQNKLGVAIAPHVILGACRPPLAQAALRASPRSACCCPATSSSAP